MNTSSLPQFPSAVCAAAVVISGLLCGCTSSARFSVDARHQPAVRAEALSYALEVGAALRSSDQSGTLAAQVLRDVHTALSAHGLYEARAGVSPDLTIEVDFARGAAVTKELKMEAPVFAEASPRPAGEASQRRAGGDTSSMPRKVGTREVTRIATIYPKRLLLTAWSAEDGGKGRSGVPLWRVDVANADEESDSVRYARLMVAAAMDWVDRSTTSPVEVVLGPRDSRVTFIAAGERRGVPAPIVAGTSGRPTAATPSDG